MTNMTDDEVWDMLGLLPLEASYPTEEDINTHLAAGRYYGRQATCGVKVRWSSYERACQEAVRLFKSNPKKRLEAYPCYFCSNLETSEYNWHVGRAMTLDEWEVFTHLADKIIEMEDVTLVGGEILRVHNRKMCEGQSCCIHNPSSHHMVEWRQHWRDDMKKMERICPHGIGHPDPDDVAFQLRALGKADTTHGCDGCCSSGPILRECED